MSSVSRRAWHTTIAPVERSARARRRAGYLAAGGGEPHGAGAAPPPGHRHSGSDK
jgi:hypothetical protein